MFISAACIYCYKLHFLKIPYPVESDIKRLLPDQPRCCKLKPSSKRCYCAITAVLLWNWFLHCIYNILCDFEDITHLFGVHS